MFVRYLTPTTIEIRPRMTMRISELATVRRTCSSSRAPRYWATMVVVAMVNPMMRATRANMTGKLTDTAPSASGPMNRPTQKLSTVLYSACNALPTNIGHENAMMCCQMLPVVKSRMRRPESPPACSSPTFPAVSVPAPAPDLMAAESPLSD